MLPLIGKLLSCPKFTASVVAVPVATLVIRRSPPTVPIERTFAAPPSVAFAPSAMELVPVDTAEDPIATPPAPLALLWKPNADEPAPLAVLWEPYPEAPSAFAAAPLPTAVAAPIVALALLPMAVLLPPLATAPVPQASSPGDAAVAPSWVAPVEQTNCATAGLLATSAPAAARSTPRAPARFRAGQCWPIEGEGSNARRLAPAMLLPKRNALNLASIATSKRKISVALAKSSGIVRN